MKVKHASPRSLALGILCGFVVLGAGCSRKSAAPASSAPAQQAQSAQPTDQQLDTEVQSKIGGESALTGQDISVNVQNAVVTLSGTAANSASRELAAAEAGSVNGVKTVINNLMVGPPVRAESAQSAHVERRHAPARTTRRRTELARAAAPPPPAAPVNAQRQPEPVKMIAPAPATPPAPVVKTVTLPAGTVIPIRITNTLDSATAQQGTAFQGALATNLEADGMLAIPAGSSVTGQIVVAKDATHFSGNSELSLELTSIQAPGRRIAVATDTYTKLGKGRGKNTAIKSGGGAVLGALIGALAGGGKGAAIGAIAGGGAGAGVNAITRGQQVKIDSESLINFRLQSPITLQTSTKAGASRSYNQSAYPQPQLEQR